MAAPTLAQTKRYMQVDWVSEDVLISAMLEVATAHIRNSSTIDDDDEIPNDLHTAIMAWTKYIWEARYDGQPVKPDLAALMGERYKSVWAF